MGYKAVFADVDGTLVAPNAHPTTKATPRVIDTVLKAQQNKVLFSIATARSFKWIAGLVESLKIKAPLILDNGARIFDTREDKYIRELYIPNAKAIAVLNELHPVTPEIHVVDEFHGEERRFVYDFSKQEPLGNIVKMMVLHIEPQEAQRLYEVIVRLGDVQITKSISGHDPVKESIHVTHNEATKSKALNWIMERLDLHKEEIIGIGDSYNDNEFLQVCGLKVAMGNSVPEIIKIADYVAPSYDDDGVADVLEKFILNSHE